MEACSSGPCPVDCEVSEWEEEGDCSESCGGGDQKETRQITVAALHGGAECPSDLERVIACNEHACPQDCILSEWARNGASKSFETGSEEESQEVTESATDRYVFYFSTSNFSLRS